MIYLFFLRLGNEVLAPILSCYFGLVLELEIFPKIFKTAKVIPIYNSGPKNLVHNYRPISLLPCLSKVLEKITNNKLVSFLEKQKIFYDYQYGFREKRGVLHALIDVITPGYDTIEQNKFTALLLMDLRKAFDSVSHRILLHKLLQYGIRGPAYTLIERYLSDRQHLFQLIMLNPPQNLLV